VVVQALILQLQLLELLTQAAVVVVQVAQALMLAQRAVLVS
jgi:hypothetical protein